MIAETATESAATAAVPPKRRHIHWRRRAFITALQVLLLAVVLGSWQLSAVQGWVDRLFSSEPSAVARSFWDQLRHQQLWHALGVSLYETLTGFAIAAVIGMTVAFVMHAVPVVQEVLQPFIAGLNSLPRLALTPLFIIWFGIGSASKIALVITLATFIILVNTYAGLRNVNRDHLILARTLGANYRQRFFTFMLPAAAPTIFAGLQLGLVYAFLAAVVGELISGGSGLGALVSTSQATINTAAMFAQIFVMGIVATIMSAIMRRIERWVLAWRVIELRGSGSSAA